MGTAQTQQINLACKGLYIETGWASSTIGGLNGSGERKKVVKVTFAKPFAAIPAVNVNLKLIDAGINANTRVEVYYQDVTKTDFNIVFRTWSDTTAYELQGHWFAIGAGTA